MRYKGFIGPSYTSQALVADAERTINLYLEANTSENAKSPASLEPSPGFQQAASVANIGGRAAATMNDRTLFVMGFGVYGIDSNLTATLFGSVALDSNPAQIAFNGKLGNQAGIASGGNLYSLNLTTNVLTSVATLAGKATMVGMIDGFGITLDVPNSRIYVTTINDFTTVDPTQFAARTDAPDNWKAMLVNPPDIWLIGSRTGGVWYDAGSFPFPLAPRPGIQFKYGIVAPFSIAAAGSSVMWLSQTTDGSGIVVRTRGYQPTRISDYALESAINTYQRNSSIDDAESIVFQFKGHTFYVLRFPMAKAAWVYDVDQNTWVQWGKWNSASMQLDIWQPRVHTFTFGKHLTADASTGIISEMSDAFGTELDGTAIVRKRRWGGPFNEMKTVKIRCAEVYLEAPALVSGLGSDPILEWQTSNDGGRTFGNIRQVKTGKIGKYQRARFWRMGIPRDRVNEVTVSDPVPYRFVDCFLNNDGHGA